MGKNPFNKVEKSKILLIFAENFKFLYSPTIKNISKNIKLMCDDNHGRFM